MPKNSTLPPLAERIRPDVLEDFIGQSHLSGDSTLLHKAIKENSLFSMILWGPPGTGKTTLAKIIARETETDFYELSAVSSGVKDVRSVLEIGKTNRQMNRQTLLFIDEIHRFNKAQQDALLHAVEQGVILFIGATTENPSFEVISPLLSRCRVLKLQPLSDDDLDNILSRALSKDDQLALKNIHFAMDVRTELIKSAGGDARKMLNTLEATLAVVDDDGGKIMIIMEVLQEALQSKTNLYDKAGDYHYDAISALIKSVRGSILTPLSTGWPLCWKGAKSRSSSHGGSLSSHPKTLGMQTLKPFH